MAKSKKVLSLALAVVMAISMLSIGAFAAKTTPTATITVSATTADGNPVAGPLQNGDAVTVTVAATASEDYFVGPTSVPVTYDPALFAVSNVTATNLFGEGTTEVVTNTDEAGKVTVVITPITAGEPKATNLNGKNVVIYTFTLTAIADAGSCDVAVVNDQKAADNLTGKLYITSFDGEDARTAELTNVGQTLVLDNATVNLTIGSAMEPAELALKAEYASSGIIIDTEKKFGDQYDGAVYGFTLDATVNVAFYTNRLEATNGGSITVVKTPYVARPVSYGTGATIEVYNSDGSPSKTYVVIIFGDVSGNGKIGAEDTGAIYDHAQNTKTITDKVKVMAANIVESGRTPALKETSLQQIKADDTGAVFDSVQGKKTINQVNVAASHSKYSTYYK